MAQDTTRKPLSAAERKEMARLRNRQGTKGGLRGDDYRRLLELARRHRPFDALTRADRPR